MNIFLLYFSYFFIYSVIGWGIETALISFKHKKFINRGFLIGPYCPIYGCACLVMILYLTQYKDNVITVFILGLVVCSILEYFTSWIMEKIFKTRWWDYSNAKFNLNGRIKGKNCLLFGLGGVAIIYLVHPILTELLSKISNNIFNIFAIVILITFIIDYIISFNVGMKFRKTLTYLELKKDSTKDFTKAVKEVLSNNHKILEKRLIKAFPDIVKLIEKKNELKAGTKEKIKEFGEDIKGFLKKNN